MRILIPILGFGNAGGYRVLSKLADELIDLGHDVNFLSPEQKDPYYPTLANVIWIDANGSTSLTKSKTDKKENAFSIQQKLTKALRTIPKDSYDVIIANHSLTTISIKKAGLTNKTLYYVQAYEPDYYHFTGGIKNKILAYLSERSYKMGLFTVVNAHLYQNYKKLNASRVLYPGIDFNLFYPKKKELLQNDYKKLVIGTIGRIEKYKGTMYILDAFIKLKKKYPLLQLHVGFGNPVDFRDYKDIHCFHPKGDTELGDFYRSLDYYICAAYSQLGAFHYPICEAMSCGIPVITTNYYPATEDNAWMTVPNNANEIIKQFELSRCNPSNKEKKIQQALNDVKQFNWKVAGEKLNFYIKELVGNSIPNS